MGRLQCKNNHYCVKFTRIVSVEKEDVLMQQLERFWKPDNAGLVPDCKVSIFIENKRAVAVLESSAKLVDGHHQLALPWREPVPKLPNNWVLTEQRLQLLKRFLRDSELFEKYKATIQDYTIKGHAKRIPEDKLVADDKLLWCLPHHPVFNPNKPGKTRVDFDCDAKFKGMSLNHQLLNGPDLVYGIMGVLARFCQE